MSSTNQEVKFPESIAVKEEPIYDFEDERSTQTVLNISPVEVKKEVDYDNVTQLNTLGSLNVKNEIKSESERDSNSEDENSFWCKVCRRKFESPEELDFHKKPPDTNKIFVCCACPKTFRDMSQLNVHTRYKMLCSLWLISQLFLYM